MLEMMTAPRNPRLTGTPAATPMPKISDSGTPSTTDPMTIPSAPPTPAAPNFRSTTLSPTMNTIAPISSQADRPTGPSTSAWSTRSKRHRGDHRAGAEPGHRADDLGRDVEHGGREAGQQERDLGDRSEQERFGDHGHLRPRSMSFASCPGDHIRADRPPLGRLPAPNVAPRTLEPR